MANKCGCKRSASDVEPQNLERLIKLLEKNFKSFEETTCKKQVETVEAIKVIRDETKIMREKIEANGDDIRAIRNDIFQLKAEKQGKCTIGGELVQNVTAIVGLKEAITWPNKIFQIIWTVILIVGIAFTVIFLQSGIAEYLSYPTATKVELLKQSIYEYPSIIFCNKMWLDAQKAISYGFSCEALKYGSGYYFYDFMNSLDLRNATEAKHEFFQNYDQNNFSSLEEFFKTIATDLEFYNGNESADFLYTLKNPGAICPTCRKLPKKVFLDNYLCYMLNIEPQKRGSSFELSVAITTADRSHGLVKYSSDWLIYVVNNSKINIRYEIDPASILSLSPFTESIVKIMPQRFLSLDTSQSCDAKNRPMTECRSDCMRSLAKRKYSCSFFEDDSAEQPPADYCNVHDEEHADTFQGRRDIFKEKESSIFSSEDCTNMEKCKEECDTTIYELALQYEVKFSEDDSKLLKAQNMTAIMVTFANEAVFRDGVLTMTEVSTMSFTSLISNLGGTLGLFIGSTMMTLVQIIMFVIKYITERINQTQ